MSAVMFSIHQAAKEGHVAWLKKASKKDLNKGDGDGWTAVHYCAWNGNLSCLGVVIERGGDVNRADSTGSTPLHIAATYGSLRALEALIENGSNLFSLDDHGRTAARVAAFYKKADCCRFLDTLALRWQVHSTDVVQKYQIKAMKDLKKRSKKIVEESKDGKPRKIMYDHSTAPVGGPHRVGPNGQRERPASTSNEITEGRKITQQDALRQNFELRTHSSSSVENGKNGKNEGNGTSSASSSASSTFRHVPRVGALLNSLAELPLKIEPPDAAAGAGGRHSVLDPSQRDSNDLPQLELTGGHPTVTLNESALATFLHSLDLVDCVQVLHNEKLDLEALGMCSEGDLISIGLSLGPRKKILNAIARRKAILAGARNLADTEF